MSEKFTP